MVGWFKRFLARRKCTEDHPILNYDYHCHQCGKWVGIKGPY